MLKDGGLDEHIPLYYSGQDDDMQGGHAFVCDGYDENDYFHYNWGWSGRDDAWCPIGALNTTKYAFNTFNGFTGHIVPQTGEYFQRADSVANMQVAENGSYDGVLLSWTNPELDLNGNALASIESVTIRRNGEVIATLTDAQPGQAMSYQDNDLAPGLYEYAIFVTNASGISRNAYRNILVGEKCPVTIVLVDEGGDGWKGAAISVTSEAADGQRIAVIGMNEGSMDTIELPLLSGNLNFIWNHGWYHSNEQYDTDDECSFLIFDGDGNDLYTSNELEDGVFMTYNNNCDFGTLTCYPVENLQGEYQWHNGEEYGAFLIWSKPTITPYLHHFQVFRTSAADKNDELIAEIAYDGSTNYGYFDNTYGVASEDTHYAVRSVYNNGYLQCESDFVDIMIEITGVEDVVNEEVKVYPNPSNGMITVEGNGHLMVLNTLGQTVKDLDIEGQITMELPRGVFFVKINGITKKVVVK